ncbi:hypothetical protein EYF80_048453 [Liparis tanakae]|uniref:Uncharacterized protein n=1 Tax=Liparis tanakae TaxID=230148 RepID=A0A4Z2FKS6_9TELE|nr:hypothetical protein EYF80_048453 [Liparis tanakae]
MDGCVVLGFSPKYSTTEPYASCKGVGRDTHHTSGNTPVSSCSLLVLMNSFSTGLSSCTRNSFLVISIPRSRERMSCSMPSSDTDEETMSFSTAAHFKITGYGTSAVWGGIPSAALSTNWISVWKLARSGYLSRMMPVMKCSSVCERLSEDLMDMDAAMMEFSCCADGEEKTNQRRAQILPSECVGPTGCRRLTVSGKLPMNVKVLIRCFRRGIFPKRKTN